MSINSMDDPVDMTALQGMLEVSRSRARMISSSRSFPEPVLSLQRWRAWRRSDVEAWLDRYRPGWRGDDLGNIPMIFTGPPVLGFRVDVIPLSQTAAVTRRRWYHGSTTWTVDSARRLLSIAKRLRRNR